MTPLHTDKELLLQIAAGDRDAFKNIYDRYWSTIYTTAISYLKSPEWAQDIVQDIFLKLWTKRERLTDVEKPDAFIFIMARNEIINALRKKFDNIPLSEKYIDYLPDDFLLPDSALALRQAENLVHEAIEQLPEQQRIVFRLTREEGLTHEAIAQRLGIQRRTVGNHATMALNNIRKYLKEHGDLLPAALALWELAVSGHS